MKRFGIVSYNIYCNFTNYGSALQSWALQQVIDRLGQARWQSVLVDYCPKVLLDRDPRDPVKHMWDTDVESRHLCELSLPAIWENAEKFDTFYRSRFRKTKQRYTADNFEQVMAEESLNGFVCGSDTIFCIDEFQGFDDGYYANYPCMRGRAAAYAASFGDAHFEHDTYAVLDQRLQNFRAVGLREGTMLPYVQQHTSVPVCRVLDPTLLLTKKDYEPLMSPRLEDAPYLLLYSRRHDPEMTRWAEMLAEKRGWRIVEISLRADHAKRHRMFYEAGVEEFLSLVNHAEYVVTNSYHGMIFSIQFQKNFRVFTREQCDTKIRELLDLCALSEQMRDDVYTIDYGSAAAALEKNRESSLHFLEEELLMLSDCDAER